jgi:hypothetical protein
VRCYLEKSHLKEKLVEWLKVWSGSRCTMPIKCEAEFKLHYKKKKKNREMEFAI